MLHWNFHSYHDINKIVSLLEIFMLTNMQIGLLGHANFEGL